MRSVLFNEEIEKLVISALLHTVSWDQLSIVSSLDELLVFPVDFLVIQAYRVDDPVHLFWWIRETKVLADKCMVVFTGIEDGTCWGDLVTAYRGTKFGNVFLMTYYVNISPGILPTQRGMYMK